MKKNSPLIVFLVIAALASATIACSLFTAAISEANAAVSEDAYWQPGSPSTAQINRTSESWGNGGEFNKVYAGTHVRVFLCWADNAMITPHNYLQPKKNIYIHRYAFDHYDGTQGYDPCDANQP